MHISEIKELRDVYKNGDKPDEMRTINIFLDNSLILHDGNPGQIILWDDENERLTCIRENLITTQSAFPYEIIVTGYEHIQNMSASVTVDDISHYLDYISYAKKDDLIQYLTTAPVNRAKLTGATGDGIDYTKLNSIEDQLKTY